MERHICKRRRIHSIKSSTVLRDTFARKYVHYLVPALMMIGRKDSTSDENREKEVDMAMALKDKHQESCRSNIEEKTKVDQLVGNQESKRSECDEEDEEEVIKERLMRLRSILPGGNEIKEVDALLGELGRYIIRLQSQLNVLTCLMEQY